MSDVFRLGLDKKVDASQNDSESWFERIGDVEKICFFSFFLLQLDWGCVIRRLYQRDWAKSLDNL